MSNPIDQKIVEMKFDNKQFESGVQKSLETLDRLKKSLDVNKSVKGLDELNKSTKGFNMDAMATAVESISSKFSALGIMGITALQNITNAAINTGKRITEALTIAPLKAGLEEYETQINSTQTIMANTSRSIKDVNAALDELNGYADKTIYNFTDMTKNAGMFTAAGMGLEDTMVALKGVGNWAAFAGAGTSDMSRATYQLGQALSAGAIRLQDWRSIETSAGMAGEKYRNSFMETARQHGIAVDQMVKNQGSFRESLTDGWLTTDIFLETMQRFANDKAMTDAATKIKTFTQLIDTTKEALGTGWATTFRTVIGDFEEARELWTNVSNLLNNVIGKSADVRNAVAKNWKNLGGREALLDGLANSLLAVFRILDPIKKAFRDVFPKIKSWDLVNLTKQFRDFTSTLGISKQTGEDLKNTFKGIFSVLDLFKTIVSEVTKALFPVVGQSGNLLVVILRLTGAIGSIITASIKWIKSTNAIPKALGVIGKTLTIIAQGFIIAAAGIANFIVEFNQLPIVKFIIDKISKSFSSFGKAITPILNKIIQGIVDFIDKIKSIKNAGMTSVLKTIEVGLSSLVGWFKSCQESVLNFIKSFKDSDSLIHKFKLIVEHVNELKIKLYEAFKNSPIGEALDGLGINADTVSDAINKIVIGINKFISTITPGKIAALVFSASLLSIAGSFSNLSASMGGVLRGMKGFFTTITMAIKKRTASYGWILAIAEAFAILAASLALLTMLDQNKLRESAKVMTLMMLGLLAVGAGMSAISKYIGIMNICGRGLLGLAASVLAMTVVLKMLENIKLDKIWEKIGIIGAIALEMSLAGIILSKMSGGSVRGALMLFAFSLSIQNAAKALITLQELDANKIKGSLSEILILIGGMSVLAIAAGKVGIGSFVGLLGVVLLLKQLMPMLKELNVAETLKESLAQVNIKTIVEKIKENIGLIASISILIGSIMIAVSVITSLVGKDISKFGIGIALMSGAILLLVECARQIGKLNDKAFDNGTKAIVGAMVFFLAIEFLASATSNAKMIPFAVSLVIMTGVIALLVQVAKAAGDIPRNKLIQGGLAVIAFGAMIALIEGLSALTGKSNAKSLAALMLSLIVLFGEMIVLTAIPWKDLLGASISMGVVIAAFGYAVGQCSNRKFKVSNVITMIAMALIVAELGYALYKMSEVPWKGYIAPVLAMSACLATFTACLIIYSKSLSPLRGLQGSKLTVIIPMIATLAVIGASLYALSHRSWEQLLPALVSFGACITLFMGLLIGMSALTKKFKLSGLTPAKAMEIAAYAAPLAAIGASLYLISTSVENPSLIIAAMAGMSGCMLALGATIAIIGKVDSIGLKSLAGGGAILLGALGVATIALSLAPLANIKWDDIKDGLKSLAWVAGTLVVVLGVLGGIGAGTGGLFSAALLLTAVAILVIGQAALTAGKGLTLMIAPFKEIIKLPIVDLCKDIKALALALSEISAIGLGLLPAGLGVASMGFGVRLLAEALIILQNVDIRTIGKAISEILISFENKKIYVDNFTKSLEGLISVVIGLSAAILVIGIAMLATGAGVLLMGAGLLLAGVGIAIAAGAILSLSIAINLLAPGLENLLKLDVSNIGVIALALIKLAGAGILLAFGTPGLIGGSIGVAKFAQAASALSKVPLDGMAGNITKIGAASMILGIGGVSMIAGSVGVSMMAKSLTEISKALENLNKAFNTGIGQTILAAGEAGIKIVIGLVTGIANSGSLVSNVVAGIRNIIVNGLGGIKTETVTVGNDIMYGTAEGMQAKAGTLKKTTEQIFNDGVYEPGKKSAKQATDIGNETGTNYVDGFKSSIGTVSTALSPTFDKVWSGLKTEGKKAFDYLTSAGKDAVSGLTGSDGVLGGVNELFGTLTGDIEDQTNAAADAITANDGFSKSLGGVGGSAGTATDALTTMTEKIKSQMDIFSEFNKKAEVSGDQMLANMRSQISGVTEWANNMQSLAFRGISQGLLQQLGELGPQGYEKVAAFVQMTDSQLQEANMLYSQSLMLPSSATQQILGSFATAGMNASLGFANGIDPVAANANMQLLATNSLNALSGPDGLDEHSPSKKTLQMGVYIVQGLVNGINANAHIPINTCITIASRIIGVLRERLNLDVGADIGRNIVEGMARGMASKTDSLIRQASELGRSVAQATKDALGEKSPSKVYKTMGMYAVMGLAIGLSSYSGVATQAAKYLAEDTINGFQSVNDAISSVIDADMDLNPVITPTLDLSNIQAGANHISSMFKDRELSANGTIQNGSKILPETATQVLFTQNNYSPKALDRVEIYRNTKNQITLAKGLVNKV